MTLFFHDGHPSRSNIHLILIVCCCRLLTNAPLAKKRKDAPIETPEDQLEELEDRLFSEVTRAHGEKAAAFAKARDLVTKGLAMIKEAQETIQQAGPTACDQAVVGGVFTEFHEMYPPVKVADAVKRRRPSFFNRPDRRTAKQMEETKKFQASDDRVIHAMIRRDAALATLKERSEKLVQTLNSDKAIVNEASVVSRRSIGLTGHGAYEKFN